MGKQLTHFSDFAQVWWPGVADSTCKKWVLYIMSTISSKSTPQFFLYFPGKQMDVRALTNNEAPNSEEDANSIINKTQNQQLLTRFCVLKDEINDFIDENPINQSLINVLDIDNCINKISILRTEFRTLCKEVSKTAADSSYVDSESTLALIKEYIINGNERKSSVCQAP